MALGGWILRVCIQCMVPDLCDFVVHLNMAEYSVTDLVSHKRYVAKHCRVTWKIREYANFVSNLLAYVINVLSP